MSKIVKTIRAYETETVRILWTCDDNAKFEQDVTIPPKATREAKTEKPKED